MVAINKIVAKKMSTTSVIGFKYRYLLFLAFCVPVASLMNEEIAAELSHFIGQFRVMLTLLTILLLLKVQLV